MQVALLAVLLERVLERKLRNTGIGMHPREAWLVLE